MLVGMSVYGGGGVGDPRGWPNFSGVILVVWSYSWDHSGFSQNLNPLHF